MLLLNAKIYTLNCDDLIIENGYILTQGKKIVAIGLMDKLDVTDVNTIDLCGQTVTPGFIDAHTHLGLWEDSLGFEGDDGNEDTDPITPHIRVLDAVNPADKCFSEAVSAGVTSVIITPGSANPIAGEAIAIKTYGKRIDKMIIKSPVGIKFAFGENPKTVYHSKNQTPVTRMATAALVREQLIKAKKYMDDLEKAKIDEDFDEPEFDIKNEALIPLFKKEIPAHIHAHRADDIFTAIRIFKEFNLNYILVHCTEGHLIADELLNEQAKCLCGPILCDRSKPELTNLTPSNPGILFKHGLLTAIITDHPVIPIQYLGLCAALAKREGLGSYDALKAITINPAKICEIDTHVGSLEIGKDADILAFSCEPISLEAKPTLVICNGEIIKYERNIM